MNMNVCGALSTPRLNWVAGGKNLYHSVVGLFLDCYAENNTKETTPLLFLFRTGIMQ